MLNLVVISYVFIPLTTIRFWFPLRAIQMQPPERCSVRKGVPRNSAKSAGKQLCQSL